LFGEKYGERVRVLQFGDFSIELYQVASSIEDIIAQIIKKLAPLGTPCQNNRVKDPLYIPSLVEEKTSKMPRSMHHHGKLDGVEFLHGNPALTLVRMTPDAMQILDDMGLMPFLHGLMEEAELAMVLQAKRSYNRDRCSITIQTPQGHLQEILLSSNVIHYALRLPAMGTIRPTTKETKQMCLPYFTNLIGQNKDGYPLANIVDTHIRLVT
jgi:hypothetical protein